MENPEKTQGTGAWPLQCFFHKIAEKYKKSEIAGILCLALSMFFFPQIAEKFKKSEKVGILCLAPRYVFFPQNHKTCGKRLLVPGTQYVFFPQNHKKSQKNRKKSQLCLAPGMFLPQNLEK